MDVLDLVGSDNLFGVNVEAGSDFREGITRYHRALGTAYRAAVTDNIALMVVNYRLAVLLFSACAYNLKHTNATSKVNTASQPDHQG